MISAVLDIIILLILIFSALNGRRKGFVMTVSSLVILVLAFLGAKFAAEALSPAVAEWIKPTVSQSISFSVSAGRGGTVYDDITYFGMTSGRAEEFARKLNDSVGDIVDSAVDTLTGNFSSSIAFIMVLIVAYVAISLILKVLFRALNIISKLPGLNLMNRLLGAFAGLIVGIMMIFVGIAILRLFDDIITKEVISSTVLFKYFASINPFFPII